MTRICFAGVTGWTAQPVLAAIEDTEDLTLVAGVARSAAAAAVRRHRLLQRGPGARDGR
jgi:4-hydroxy-tetrahydrodipicolinate reductase